MGMFDDVVDVVQCFFRQVCVFIFCEQVFVVFSQRLVYVYVGIIVVNQRFGYEGSCFVVSVSYVVNVVFQDLNFVCFVYQVVGINADFILFGSFYFVVMYFDGEIYLFYSGIYSSMQVMQ